MKYLLLSVCLLVPASVASAQEWRPTLLHVSIGASMVGHGTDVAVSMYHLGRDPTRYREANPILRPFADRPLAFGVVKMGLAVGVNVALLKVHRARPRLALAMSLAQTAAIGYVAWRNQQAPR